MRYVLVDRFLELARGERARAVKCVTLGEPFLRELDGYPPALLLESLLQTGGVLARSSAPDGARTVLGKVESAEFFGRVEPGDRVELAVDVILSRPEGTLCRGVASVEGRAVARAEFMIVNLPPELAPPRDPELERYAKLLGRALNIPAEDT